MSKNANPTTGRPRKAVPVLSRKPPPAPRRVGPPDLSTLVLPKGKARPDLATLAKIYEIGKSTLYRWRVEGLNVYDPLEVLGHIQGLVSKPPAYRMMGGIRTYEEARLRKTLLEADRIQRQLDRDDLLEVPRGLVYEDSLAAATVLKSGILALESELPPLLVGLTEREMQGKLRPLLTQLLLDLTANLHDKYAPKL